MILEDMMKTDTYKMADCVEYINASGTEIGYKEYFLSSGEWLSFEQWLFGY